VSFQRTDHGNAQILAELFAGKLRYDYKFQRWIGWNAETSTWMADSSNAMTNAAIVAAEYRAKIAEDIADGDEKRSQLKYAVSSKNLKSIQASLKIAASLPQIAYTGEWDTDPFIFHASNGLIDLKTGEYRQAKPEDNVLKISPVAYDKNADCPKWKEFLKQIFQSNLELINYFQRCVGYTLSGNVGEQVLFACHGVGSNGKSTALGVISHIMGEYSTDLAGSSLEKWGRVVIGEGVDLVGARFAKCEEIGDGALDVGKVKAWTGENVMRVRPLRKEWFSFQPTHKLWLTFNSFPCINDHTAASYRRIKPIPFAAEFKEQHIKRNLLGELKAEASGILNWMIEGCLAWQRADGLAEPEICKRNLAEFRLLEDWVHSFLTDETTERKDSQISSHGMYSRYLHWCTKEGISSPVKHSTFSQALKSSGLKTGRNKAERYWEGRELKPAANHTVITFPQVQVATLEAS
jgi:putative DNA primase/helicase